MASSGALKTALAGWVLLVLFAYTNFHLDRLALPAEALRAWLATPLAPGSLAAVLPGHLAALGAVLVLLLLAWLGAYPLIGWAGGNAAPPLALAAGLGTASLLAFAAGLTGLYRSVLLVPAALLFAAAGGAFHLLGPAPFRAASVRKIPGNAPRWLAGACLGMAGISASLNLLGALAPEVGYDSLIQHLADPRDYLAAHKVYFKDLSFLAQHPAGLQMLYGFLIPLAQDRGPMVLHWAFGLLACWAFWHWGRRNLPRADAILWAGALYLTPFFGILSSRAYVDLGLVFFAAAALLAPWGSWIQGAILGAAIGAKYSGGFLLLGWLALFAFQRRRAAILRVALAAAAAAAVWGVRNWINTGDPLYPFGYPVFGGIFWDGHSAREYGSEIASYGRVYGLAGRLAIPWLTFVRDKGALDDGSLGPLVLMLAPLLLLAKGRLPRELSVLAAVSWALYLISPRQVRYALPYLPVTLAALAFALRQALDRWPASARPAATLILGALTIQLGVSVAALYTWSNPYPVATGAMPRRIFLSRIMEPRDERTGKSLYLAAAGRSANSLPPGARGLMIGDAKVHYFPGRWEVCALFNPRVLKRFVAESRGPDQVAKRLRQRGTTHVLYNVGGSMHIEYTHGLYRWSDRELALLEDFFAAWMAPVWRTETAGGEPAYLLFELKRGRHDLPEYLPGIDTLMAGLEETERKEGRAAARRAAKDLLSGYPSSRLLRRKFGALAGERSRPPGEGLVN